jgi:hypothetical protein
MRRSPSVAPEIRLAGCCCVRKRGLIKRTLVLLRMLALVFIAFGYAFRTNIDRGGFRTIVTHNTASGGIILKIRIVIDAKGFGLRISQHAIRYLGFSSFHLHVVEAANGAIEYGVIVHRNSD